MKELIEKYREYLRWRADNLSDAEIMVDPDYLEFVMCYIKIVYKKDGSSNG